MQNLIISAATLDKLKKKHGVERREVEQCFLNADGPLLEDKRARHRTEPPTLWFIAETNAKRLLKIVYIREDGKVHLKSAFDPNDEEMNIYRKMMQE